MLNEKHNRRFFFIPLFLLLLVFLIQAPAWADTTRTITLDANGGTFPANYWTKVPSPTIDVTFNVRDDGRFSYVNVGTVPSLENKYMLGWSVSQNASRPQYRPQGFQDVDTSASNARYVPMDGSVTILYAVWGDDFHITLNANGGDFGTKTDRYGNSTPIETATYEFWALNGKLWGHDWVPEPRLRNSTKIHKGWSVNKDAHKPEFSTSFDGMTWNSSTPKTLYAIYGEKNDWSSSWSSDDSKSSSNTDTPNITPGSVSPSTYAVGAFSYTVKNGSATIISSGNKKAVKLTIPATVTINGKSLSVTSIAPNAFTGMKNLTSVVIGKNVKSIGKNAFKGCSKLKKITIKTIKLTKKSIGTNAFKGIQKKAVVKCPKAKKATYKKILLKKGMKKTMTFK